MRTDLRNRAAAVLAAAALAIATTACGNDTVERSTAATLVNNAPGFFPTSIIVNQEDQVLLRVGNGTDREHGFTIEGYRRSTVVRPNETKEIKFKAARAGAFKIFCQLHPAHQTATLIVQ
ncbi:MAG: cupredoxin domain-containing protein [Acidimicrobiales bacterium]